jgi:hypothetical protein
VDLVRLTAASAALVLTAPEALELPVRSVVLRLRLLSARMAAAIRLLLRVPATRLRRLL